MRTWRVIILLKLYVSWNYMSPILVSFSGKRIGTQILVVKKLNWRKDFIMRDFAGDIIRPSKELLVQS